MPGHIVLSRVPVANVLGVKPGFDLAAWTRRLRHLQYDYVVCTKDASVLAVIQLEDSRSSGKSPTLSDLTKERATVAAGVRLLRWQARAFPDQAEIQTALGEPLTQFFEEFTSSANQSWWPPLSSARRNPAPN